MAVNLLPDPNPQFPVIVPGVPAAPVVITGVVIEPTVIGALLNPLYVLNVCASLS